MKQLAMLTRPVSLLRLEGGALLLIALLVYAHLDAPWVMFALLFLVPDLSAVGYLAGSQAGAITYNLAHTTVPAAILAAGSILSGNMVMLTLATIWFAHISIDRFMGYGLKEADAFGHTHLGMKGSAQVPQIAPAHRGTAT